MSKFLFIFLPFLLTLNISFADVELDGGVLIKDSQFTGSALGVRDYLLYVPDVVEQHKPNKLVVMLHGCMQTNLAFFEGSKVKDYADENGFIVLLPQQSEELNPYGCWNWFLPTNQVKGTPFVPNEPSMILKIISSVRMRYNVSGRESVFVAGMSAGGAMASVIASCYPNEVGAIATSQGIKYAAAAMSWWDMDALKALGQDGSEVTAEATAMAAYGCTASWVFPSSYIGKTVPSIIFHGSGDNINMSYAHAEQMEDHFLIFNDYLDNGFRDNSRDYAVTSEFVQTEGIYPYEVYKTYDSTGLLTVERYKIFGLGHAWSGGTPDTEWFDSKGPDATELSVNFFKKFGL